MNTTDCRLDRSSQAGSPLSHWHKCRPWFPSASRKGSAAVLMLVMCGVFVILAAITIDYSYMQLIESEMRAATDAAAKAGAEALARTQNSTTAKNEAIRYASANKVGGKAFNIAASDIEIGRVSPSAGGTWAFSAAGTPPNAVRVNARTGTGTAQEAYSLFFSGVLGRATFAPSTQATAGQQSVEVCLCIDRSGSMQFDMSGVEYSYPTGNPNLSNFTAWGTMWQYYVSPPHPTASRWAAMMRAVNIFLDRAANFSQPPRTALVTWGSDYTLPVSPYTQYTSSSTDLVLPSENSFSFTSNANTIRGLLNSRAQLPIAGGTTLSSGLDRAVSVLRGTNSNSHSNKIVILLTDGQWNAGRSPVDAAWDARAAGVVVHCVSMLTGSQPDLQSAANITGGRYYGTTNETELANAFDELARTLPIVLTQ